MAATTLPLRRPSARLRTEVVHLAGALTGCPAGVATAAARVAAAGPVPLVTLAGAAAGDVADGVHDGALRAWAAALAGADGEVWLGCADLSGSPVDRVLGWRRVSQVFEDAGAGMVQLMWHPTVPRPGRHRAAGDWPGSPWVDRVGLVVAGPTARGDVACLLPALDDLTRTAPDLPAAVVAADPSPGTAFLVDLLAAHAGVEAVGCAGAPR